MLMRLLGVGVVAWFLSAPAAWAQPPGPPWWKDGRSREELRLSDDQSARVDALFKEALPKMRASYEELSRQEKQLSVLVAGNDTTEADIVRHLKQVTAARAELNKVRTLMLYRMYRVLSPEQRAKLEEIRKRHERERQPRGSSRGPSQGHDRR